MTERDIEELIRYEIKEATKEHANDFRTKLVRMRNQDNALTIAKYVISMNNEGREKKYQ